MKGKTKVTQVHLTYAFRKGKYFFIFVYILYTIFVKMSNLIIVTFCKSHDL